MKRKLTALHRLSAAEKRPANVKLLREFYQSESNPHEQFIILCNAIDLTGVGKAERLISDIQEVTGNFDLEAPRKKGRFGDAADRIGVTSQALRNSQQNGNMDDTGDSKRLEWRDDPRPQIKDVLQQMNSIVEEAIPNKLFVGSENATTLVSLAGCASQIPHLDFSTTQNARASIGCVVALMPNTPLTLYLPATVNTSGADARKPQAQRVLREVTFALDVGDVIVYRGDTILAGAATTTARISVQIYFDSVEATRGGVANEHIATPVADSFIVLPKRPRCLGHLYYLNQKKRQMNKIPVRHLYPNLRRRAV
jgi:hypothetical protein